MQKYKAYINKINDYMDAQGLKGKISFFKILLDVFVCSILYGATISDYFIFRFYEKRAYVRKTFITARDKRRFYAVMNDEEKRRKVQNKDIFNRDFSEYLKRDWIFTPDCGSEAFCDFVKNHESVFIKPVELGGGEGIIKISANDVDDLNAIYDTMCKDRKCVVEAGIVQHPDMASIHPESVNTIRICTFYDDENVRILFAGMRCGVGKAFVDNHMSGGLAMLIDSETGKVSSTASSKGEINILKHPDTNVFLPGFQIPHWDKCLKLIDCVARKTPGVHFVGWDLAILQDDVCLIEANPGAAFATWQETTQTGHKAETDLLVDYMIKKRQA